MIGTTGSSIATGVHTLPEMGINTPAKLAVTEPSQASRLVDVLALQHFSGKPLEGYDRYSASPVPFLKPLQAPKNDHYVQRLLALSSAAVDRMVEEAALKDGGVVDQLKPNTIQMPLSDGLVVGSNHNLLVMNAELRTRQDADQIVPPKVPVLTLEDLIPDSKVNIAPELEVASETELDLALKDFGQTFRSVRKDVFEMSRTGMQSITETWRTKEGEANVVELLESGNLKDLVALQRIFRVFMIYIRVSYDALTEYKMEKVGNGVYCGRYFHQGDESILAKAFHDLLKSWERLEALEPSLQKKS